MTTQKDNKRRILALSLMLWFLLPGATMNLLFTGLGPAGDGMYSTPVENTKVTGNPVEGIPPGSGLKPAAGYDPQQTYAWWNRSFSYRIPVMVNMSRWEQKAQTLRYFLNFSQILEDELGIAQGTYTFDEDSVRLVEYDAVGEMIVQNDLLTDDDKYVVPSTFYTISDNLPTRPAFSATTNAWGILVWNLNGTTPAETNRTYMAYFDITENNDLPAPSGNIQWQGEVYGRTNAYGGSQYGLFAGTYLSRPYFFDPNGVSNSLVQYPGSGSYRGTAVGDFNKDGNIDAATTGSNNYNLVFMNYDEGTGGWNVNTTLTVDTDGSRSEQLSAGDINGDGYEELVATNVYQDRLEVFTLNPSTDTFSASYVTDAGTVDPYALSIFDLDGDGVSEIIQSSSSTHALYLRRHTTGNNYPVFQTIPNAMGGSNPMITIVGDFDMDGNWEVVISGWSSTVYIYQWDNASGQLQLESSFNAGRASGVDGIVASDVADWDNDGKLEMIVGSYDYGANSYPGIAGIYIKVYEIKGPDTWPTGSSDYEWINSSTMLSGQASWRFADYNNDGTIEVVGGNRHGWMVGYQKTSASPVWVTQDFRPSNEGDWFAGFIGDNLDVFNRYTWKENRYYPVISLGPAEMKKSDLTVVCYDLDDNLLPGANVTVWNSTPTEQYFVSQSTGSTGATTFNDLNFTSYLVSIQYQTEQGWFLDQNLSVVLTKVKQTLEVYTNITHLELEFLSNGGDPLTMGWVLVYNDSSRASDKLLANLTLDNEGKVNFYGPHTEVYYYNVTYENALYTPVLTPVKSGEVWPHTLTNSTLWVNETASDIGGGKWQTVNTVYANGTTGEGASNLGDSWITWANLTIYNVTDQMTELDLYYLNSFGVWTHWPSSATPSCPITSFSDPNNYYLGLAFLNSPFGPEKVYGLRAFVTFQNASMSRGNVTWIVQEAQSEAIDVPMVKIPINVIDTNDQFPNGLKVTITNNTGSGGQLTAELWTDASGNAYDGNGVEFWYLKKDGVSDNFTMSMNFYGTPIAFRNDSTPAVQYKNTLDFNCTSKPASPLVFRAQLDTSAYVTELVPLQHPTKIFTKSYRDEFTLLLMVNVTRPGGPASGERIDIDNMDLSILDATTYQYIGTWTISQNGSTGYYTITLNSTEIGLRGSHQYRATVSAQLQGYGGDPDPIEYTMTINPIQTSFGFYDQSLQALPLLELYWNDATNITVKYWDSGLDAPITGATVTYSWSYGSGTLYPVTGHKGYYSFKFNSTTAENYGTHWIKVTAQKENYTSKTNQQLDIKIYAIPTTINDQRDYLQVDNITVAKTKEKLLYFTFWDIHNDVGITGIQTANFTWRQFALGEGGTLVNESSSPERLVDLGNGTYLLDFDTEFREAGRYSFLVTLAQPNYETKVAFVVMEIQNMTITPKWDDLSTFRVSQPRGNLIELTFSLWDDTNNAPLTGATVTGTFPDGTVVTFNESADGVYTYVIDTSSDEYKGVFARALSFPLNISISKENYTTITERVYVTVDLPEIFPGFPTFYFVIIVGIVAAMVITIGMYRYVQYARIPAVVKKIRRTVGDIKKNRDIGEELLSPTPTDYLIDRFSAYWEELGLDIEKNLKGKKLAPSDAGENKKKGTGGYA
ncbi:MAG: FG-GAP repeat domain-containing protein [Promethearchaeota archaeon]